MCVAWALRWPRQRYSAHSPLNGQASFMGVQVPPWAVRRGSRLRGLPVGTEGLQLPHRPEGRASPHSQEAVPVLSKASWLLGALQKCLELERKQEEAGVASAHGPDHQEPGLAPPPPSLGTRKPARWCGVFESWGVGCLQQPPFKPKVRKAACGWSPPSVFPLTAPPARPPTPVSLHPGQVQVKGTGADDNKPAGLH